jgi:hypothetical protein
MLIGALGSHYTKTTTHWDPVTANDGENGGFRTGCLILTYP